MKNKLFLLILPALLALTSCQNAPINKQSRQVLDDIIEDTLAHDEVFGESSVSLVLEPKKTVELNPISTSAPMIGIQTKTDNNSTPDDASDDKISIRYVAAISDGGNLENVTATWTRAIYNADGTVYKASAEKQSLNAYTGLASADDLDDVLTIAEFNSTNSTTSYTHFVVYTVLNIPLATYSDAMIFAYINVDYTDDGIDDGTKSKTVATSVDQQVQFAISDQISEAWSSYVVDLALTPKKNNVNNTYSYGLYPQTVVTDSDLLTALNALGDSAKKINDWYLYNGHYYVTVNAVVDSYSACKFTNGSSITEGEKYWFKCEPIVWKVLSGNYLLSNALLEEVVYYGTLENRTIGEQKVYANNYKYSNIRAWLNGYDGSSYNVSDYSASGTGFLNTAFALNNSYILTTVVNNNDSTTNDATATYACENTEDKVFLPSFQDYLDSNYGFDTDKSASSTTRQCQPTDYARATHAHHSNGGEGWYWTRSPARNSGVDYDGYSVTYIDETGWINGSLTARNDRHCARPAIKINIA